MAEAYQAVSHCKRWDICNDIRDCPIYRGMREKVKESLGDDGFETVQGTSPEVSVIHFDGHHQEGDSAVGHRVIMMANKYEGSRRPRKGSRRVLERNCYFNVVMEAGPPELEGELQGIHSERRLRLAGEASASP